MTTLEKKEKLQEKKSLIDCHTHVGISSAFYERNGYPYALSFEDLVIRMKILGIDYSVVFPFVDSLYYAHEQVNSKIKTTTKFSRFPYEVENRNLLFEIYEVFPHYSSMALPFLMFDPSRRTKMQAAFMEELAEKYAVFGLKTATTYIQAFVNDLETKGRAILDFVRKKNLPILFHSSVHPSDPWASVNDIIGFAERHPDIRVCVAHSARFSKPALDKAARLGNCFVDLSAFSIHCELARQNSPAVAQKAVRFQANYGNPWEAMKALIDSYPHTIIWGSDTPFYYWIQKYYTDDGALTEDTLRCAYDEEKTLLDKFEQDIQLKIAYKNTLRFLFGGEK